MGQSSPGSDWDPTESSNQLSSIHAVCRGCDAVLSSTDHIVLHSSTNDDTQTASVDQMILSRNQDKKADGCGWPARLLISSSPDATILTVEADRGGGRKKPTKKVVCRMCKGTVGAWIAANGEEFTLLKLR